MCGLSNTFAPWCTSCAIFDTRLKTRTTGPAPGRGGAVGQPRLAVPVQQAILAEQTIVQTVIHPLDQSPHKGCVPDRHRIHAKQSRVRGDGHLLGQGEVFGKMFGLDLLYPLRNECGSIFPTLVWK